MTRRNPQSIIDHTTLPSVLWRPGSTCSYKDTVAVFRFELTAQAALEHPQNGLLPDEISHAQRYHRQEDRNRYSYTRRMLRILIGNYVNQPPNVIYFTTGMNRKPELKDNTDWHFNVSHSGNCILIAIAKGSVGVDVEKMVPGFSFQAIVAHSFSLSEQEYLEASPDARSSFYQLWTRKEALVKATAKGLDDDFAQIPALDGVHVVGSDLIGATGNWTVTSFDAFDGYPAAVAYPAMAILPEFYTLTNDFFFDSEENRSSL